MVYEMVRYPLDKGSLARIKGVVSSFRIGTNRETVHLVVENHGDEFVLSVHQPGFRRATGIRNGDKVELLVDTRPLGLKRSVEVYALMVNGETLATYNQTLVYQRRAKRFGYDFVVWILIATLYLMAIGFSFWGWGWGYYSLGPKRERDDDALSIQ